MYMVGFAQIGSWSITGAEAGGQGKGIFLILSLRIPYHQILAFFFWFCFFMRAYTWITQQESPFSSVHEQHRTYLGS